MNGFVAHPYRVGAALCRDELLENRGVKPLLHRWRQGLEPLLDYRVENEKLPAFGGLLIVAAVQGRAGKSQPNPIGADGPVRWHQPAGRVDPKTHRYKPWRPILQVIATERVVPRAAGQCTRPLWRVRPFQR